MFCRPVLIEVPHFASLHGNEREITILRSDNGQTWREHSVVASEEAVQEALEGSFTGENKKSEIFQRDFLLFVIKTPLRTEDMCWPCY
jgi:ZU5 domain